MLTLAVNSLKPCHITLFDFWYLLSHFHFSLKSKSAYRYLVWNGAHRLLSINDRTIWANLFHNYDAIYQVETLATPSKLFSSLTTTGVSPVVAARNTTQLTIPGRFDPPEMTVAFIIELCRFMPQHKSLTRGQCFVHASTASRERDRE